MYLLIKTTWFQSDAVQIKFEPGVSSVGSGMMVGRPGAQPQNPGAGPMGNPSSKFNDSSW